MLKRRDNSMNEFSRIVKATILAMSLAAAAANAQAPGNAPGSASADCADVPSLAAKLERTDQILRDRPTLARYAEANAAVPAPTKFALRVVFMGDSITDAWVSPEYGGFFPGKPDIGRGISGQVTPQVLVRVWPGVMD